ncbi:PH domain-containing protein [Brevibacterium luteolum]|uniref:PH domain-containing protein n=1 Tax=Brevibacterium luteolum TaxID=199591 RepID=UPI00223C47A4|nr:PH domain-containing protein [Brevibacterium luteolum]MCT1828568.1 PH domain-containing protein [Brevibacterium luteolum]
MFLAITIVVSFTLLSWGLTQLHWTGWKTRDIIWMNALGVIFGAVVWRVGAIAAFVTDEALIVRNIFSTTRVEWTRILSISFHPRGGDSWVTLDLSDGSTLSVMAIQSADGDRARYACERLRRLVDTYSSPDVPDN